MFLLRVYLSRRFTKADLTIYFTLIDALGWMALLFSGFKDALGRIFNIADNKQIVIRDMFIAAAVVWITLSISIIPYLHKVYLPNALPDYDLNIIEVEAVFVLLVTNLILSYVLLVNRVYHVISALDFVRGLLFVACFFALYFTVSLHSGYQYLIKSTVLLNIFLFFWQLWCIARYTPMFTPLKLMRIRGQPDRKKKKDFYIFSILSSTEYASASVYVYLSSFMILSMYSQAQLADFQIVARPIYMALIAIFSFPIFRFMFPEFSLIAAKLDIPKIKNIKKKFINICMVFGFIVITGTWLSSKTLLGLIFPVEYIEAADMLNILIIGLPFVVYTAFAFAIIKATGGFKYTLIIRLAGAMSFFAALYVFQLWGGVFSVIYAMLVSVLVMFIGSCWVETNILANLFSQNIQKYSTMSD